MQSHKMFPPGVRSRKARWLMAKAGTVCTLSKPGSCRRQALRCASASASRVVQDWPPPGTNWRSSSQMGQRPGGCGASG